MNRQTQTLVQYVICLGAFLSNLSAGMFNIALVDIAKTFDARITSAQWIITVYLLVISVLLPIMGRLGDMVGRRRIHNLGYFTFMLGALCCAFAPSLTGLVLFRILQGIGASMYQATNMALIVSVFPREQRGKALGLISTFVAAGSMVGPSLGGVLIQWFSWRTNFWLLAAIATIAWILAQRLIPRDIPEKTSKLDLIGAALFAVALTGLVTGFSVGPQWGWTSQSVLLLFTGFLGFGAGFAAWCLSPRWAGNQQKEPFIQLRLFDDGAMNSGIWVTIATYMAAFAAQLVLPIFLRDELGVQPAMAGVIMMGYPLSLIVAAPLCGDWSDRRGTRPILSAGLLLMIGTLAALSFLSSTFSPGAFMGLVIGLGVAMGMINSPNNSLVMSRVAKQHLGLISSVLALSRNLGMMLGTAAGGALLAINGAKSGSPDLAFPGYRAVFALCMLIVLLSLGLMLFSTGQMHRHKEALTSETEKQAS